MIDALLALFQQYAHWFYWLALSSIACLIVSILLIPTVIKRLPYDYFTSIQASDSKPNFNWRKFIIKIFSNVLGAILVFAGIIMLFIPGQGLLTILIGLLMLDIPGKKKLEVYIISFPAVINGLNWVRKKQGLMEFQPPAD